ncbi:MAG: glutathione S-transferase N-terminal domain-containing protein [Candidatus Thiodiazotropha sp. 6PLUC2]
MSMKFYMTPGSCSTGIHILLEELDLVFEAHLVNLMAGDQHRDDYLAINPKGTIPTLLLDSGKALTDFQSIAWWLARSHPKSQLIPQELEAEVRVLEVMNYAVNTLHGEGFTRIFTTDQYTTDADSHEAIKARGQEIVEQGFTIVESWLEDRDFISEHFGIADAALFYVEFWADRIDIPLPENLLNHYRRILQRASVKQVLMEEGYASVYRKS